MNEKKKQTNSIPTSVATVTHKRDGLRNGVKIVDSSTVLWYAYGEKKNKNYFVHCDRHRAVSFSASHFSMIDWHW